EQRKIPDDHHVWLGWKIPLIRVFGKDHCIGNSRKQAVRPPYHPRQATTKKSRYPLFVQHLLAEILMDIADRLASGKPQQDHHRKKLGIMGVDHHCALADNDAENSHPVDPTEASSAASQCMV